MPVLPAAPHPALGVLAALRAREAAMLAKTDLSVLYAFQPRVGAEASRLADELGGAAANSGELNLAAFNEGLAILERNGIALGFMQKQLINVARLILLRRMFGDGLAAALRELEIKYAFTELYEQAAVTLPRRAGKTVAQTLLAALVAATQPDGNVCCFNLGSRQSHEWLAQAIGVLQLFRGTKFDWKLEAINSHEKVTIRNWTGRTSTISSYPGPRDNEASNFRGMGTRLMLLLYDEFYFFKEVVYTTSLPLSRNGAAILMISSMSKNHDDAVRRMIETKLEDDTQLFLTLDWMRACPDCVRAGTQNACTHIEHRPQHFEPRGSMRRQRQLISPFGRENFERELLNMAAQSNRLPAFHPAWLTPLRDPTRDYQPPTARDLAEFFVGLDPAGGGFSNTAIVSVAFDRLNPPPGCEYRLVVLAAEVLPKWFNTADLGDEIVRHVLRVRATIPGLRQAKALICIENNSIGIADNIERGVQRRADAINIGIMQERRTHATTAEIDVRAGTHTTNRSKEAIVARVAALLTSDALHLHARFFVPHALEYAAQLAAHADTSPRERFVNEIANICGEIMTPKGASGQVRPVIRYRGYRADGQRATDDMFWAMGFCLQCQTLYSIAPQQYVRWTKPGRPGVSFAS